MRIGLIARAGNTGLGIQTWEFARHMQPAKTLIVRVGDTAPGTFFPERFGGELTIVPGLPRTRALEEFLDDLDVVYTAETPYNYELFSLAAARGVGTVLHYNFEFLDYLQRPRLPKPSLFAAPSSWRMSEVPANKLFLPVPVALDRFTPRGRREHATRFLHIVGKPAINDRNGTPDLLAALAHVQSQVTVTIKCQDPKYVSDLLRSQRIPPNVDLVLDIRDAENYWDNYSDQDVLVMPRRFGGLCLPVQEALAAGMPVIMPSITPNFWLPERWLVPAELTGRFMARSMIDIWAADPRKLAARIDEFATDTRLFADAQTMARYMAFDLSWDVLRPTYERVLADVARS